MSFIGRIVIGASQDRLDSLIEERLQPGADKQRIDARIWDLFGEDWAVMFTDLSGFSRRVAEFGIIHFLQTIHEAQRILVPVIEAVPWSLRALSSHQSIDDIVVPVGCIPQMLERLQSLRQAYSLRIPMFGRAGDGNLHAHPLKNPGDSVEKWQELAVSASPSCRWSWNRPASS